MNEILGTNLVVLSGIYMVLTLIAYAIKPKKFEKPYWLAFLVAITSPLLYNYNLLTAGSFCLFGGIVTMSTISIIDLIPKRTHQ